MTLTTPITIPTLQKMKQEGRPISMVTAYDATFARLLDGAQVDMVLVGDSLGMVIQGGANTLAVTLEDMIYHVKCVGRGLKRAHLMADMPFMSYQASAEQAMMNAGRLLKEAGAHSVKVEGGMELAETVQHMVAAGIPVMAHIGLRPQRYHQMGGYAVQGKKDDDAKRLINEAKAFEQAGAFGLLLEGIPATLAQKITETVDIPTIGIGAGAKCDGQVLVIYDLLGMDAAFNPKFAKKYAELQDVIVQAVGQYVQDVKERKFPGAENAY